MLRLPARIVCFIALTAAAPSLHAIEINSINLLATRISDDTLPGQQFRLEVDVNIPGIAGVTGVTAGSMTLEQDGGSEWSGQINFSSLSNLQSQTNGTVDISVSGANPGSSAFTFNANALEDSDFFATPAVLNPLSSATVSPKTVFSWTAPGGISSGNAVFVDAGGNESDQADDSILGALTLNSTSWTAPNVLDLGQGRFQVGYYDLSHGDLVSALTGTIAWGDSPDSPAGYPAGTPLMVVGGETRVSFNVVPEPSSLLLGVIGGAIALACAIRRNQPRRWGG
jgi:hypothetical protein